MRPPAPTWRLAAVAVVGALVVLVAPEIGRTALPGWTVDNRFLLVNALLVVAAIVDLALATSTRRVRVERRFPASVTLGHDVTLAWAVSTAGSRSARVSVADALAPSLGAETRRFSLDVPAVGHAVARVAAHPGRRGRYGPDEFAVRSFGPLGLLGRQRRVRQEDTIRVLPPFRSADEAALQLRRARSLEVGLRSAVGRGGGTEFESLRELTPDDETRRIDWAATARSRNPIVRTYRAERNQQVLCVLDSGRIMAGRVQAVPRLEWAMDGAMLVAELSTGLSDRFGLVAFDRTVHTTVPPSARRSQRSRIAETLFDLQPALVESDYGHALRHVAGRYPRRSFVVLLTELETESAEQFLIPALPSLVRRHVVVVAAVADPDVAAWARGEVADDAEGVLLRATADAERHRRALLAARMRGLGALVVDETPDRFAGRLGEVYLDTKAAGRL